MAEEKKKPRMSKETLERLSKPLKHKEAKLSPVCTFAPELCEKSKELVGAREKFHERIDSLIANHRKAMSDRAKPKIKFTFKPDIEMGEAFQSKLAGRGTFKKRTEDDIKQRQRKTEQREKDALKSFTFKPEITKSPKGVKVKGKFLSRVKEDINARQNRETSEKPNPECKFKPEISKNTQKIMRAKGMPKFMSRMTEDLEARRDKQEEIKKALMKPPKLYKKARPRKKALKKE